MKIGPARIDDRLIHGQVATRWTKETNVSRIIVVSDEVAADHVRKTLLTVSPRRASPLTWWTWRRRSASGTTRSTPTTA